MLHHSIVNIIAITVATLHNDESSKLGIAYSSLKKKTVQNLHLMASMASSIPMDEIS